MNEVDENNKLLSLLGLALFQAQALEYSIVSLFAINKISIDGKWTIEVRNLMDSKYKQTLGKLLNDVSKKVDFDSSLKTKLYEALELRNWIVHRFFREFGSSGLSNQLRSKAITKLYKIAFFFEQVSDEITSINIELMQQSGRSIDEIENGINIAINCYLDDIET